MRGKPRGITYDCDHLVAALEQPRDHWPPENSGGAEYGNTHGSTLYEAWLDASERFATRQTSIVLIGRMHVPRYRTIACASALLLLCAASVAQPVAPYGVLGPPAYFGCGGIYLELARQNDDLARIRTALRRLELETDESVRARQWINALDAENRNLRQQNVLFQQRVIALEKALAAAPRDEPLTPGVQGRGAKGGSLERKP